MTLLFPALALVGGCGEGSPHVALDAGSPLDGAHPGPSRSSEAGRGAPASEGGPGRPVRPDAGPPIAPCNGAPHLCPVPLDRVVFAGTHDSAANVTPPWQRLAQHSTIRRQLDDGIRALFLESHERQGKLVVCYGDCAAGYAPLSNALADIRGFLDDNPREVVLLFVENHAGGALTTAVVAAGLADAIHRQQVGEAWPTLEQMIDSERRVVLLVDDVQTAGDGGATEDPGTSSGFTPLWDVAFTTPVDAADLTEPTCDPSRGRVAEHSLFVLPHLVRTTADAGEDLTETVNSDPFLTNRVHACEANVDHVVNVVAVDFYDAGDVLNAVVLLNRER